MFGAGNELTGFWAGGASPPVVTKTDSASDTTATTFTFSSMSIGTATADRWVVVCVSTSASANRSITGITIGGNSTDTIGYTGLGSATGSAIAMSTAPVTSGTTTTVVVTMANSTEACGITVYTITGLRSNTPVDSTTGNGTATNVTNTGIAVSAGGCVIMTVNHANTNAVTWTTLTEDTDFTFRAGSANHSTGSGQALSASASFTGNAAWSGSVAYRYCIASWR